VAKVLLPVTRSAIPILKQKEYGLPMFRESEYLKTAHPQENTFALVASVQVK